MKKNLKIYISHSIRGKFGQGATFEQMDENNRKAIRFLNCLQKNFPEIKWYLPGELDGFLIPRGINPKEIVEALLTLDCAIVGQSDGILIYSPDDYISEGMKREFEFAVRNKKHMFIFNSKLYGKGALYDLDAVSQIAEWLRRINRE